MSDTIIIECNRQIAKKLELETLSKGTAQSYDVLKQVENQNNNTWKNVIQSGIQVNVGDQISVEATMINTKGSPDETIEFLGANNSLNSAELIDNQAQLEFAYYITNQQDFNFNLPTSQVVIYNSVATAQGVNYGLPNVDTFANFVKAYPYKEMSGWTYVDGSPPTWTGPNTDGVSQNAPEPIDAMNTTRFYFCPGFVPGAITTDNNIGVWEEPQIKTTFVNVSVEEGFNTPSSVANRITGQLQARLGNAEEWDTDDFIQPNYYEVVNGVIATFDVPSVITQTYKAVNTTTGALFNARAQGKWSSKFDGEGGTDPEGTNYQSKQGNEILWKNIMSAHPKAWVAKCKAWNSYHQNSIDPTLLNTTNFEEEANQLCRINQAEICLTDILEAEANPSNSINVATSRVDNSVLNNAEILELAPYTCIPTNLTYQTNTLNYLNGVMKAEEYFNETSDARYDSPNQAEGFQMELIFGRYDDANCLGKRGHYLNLVPPDWRVNNTNPNLSSYIQKNGAIGDELGYRMAVPINATRNAFATPAKLGTLLRNGGHGNNTLVQTRFLPLVFQNTPESGGASFKLSANSLFTFFDSNGLRHPYLLSQEYDIAIVPVFYKEANLPNPNLKDVPFCAFVSLGFITQKNCLYPATFESLGNFSISFNNNQLSYPITTQKVGRKTGLPDYPDESECVDYFPFCYIGADSPQLKFDSNGDGRFSLTSFHTDYKPGNGTFQVQPEKANPQSAQSSAVAQKEGCSLSHQSEDDAMVNPSKQVASLKPFPYITAQAGIGLMSMKVPKKGTGELLEINTFLPEVYKDTLFSKLGFNIEQLLPSIGFPQTEFDRNQYNQFIGLEQQVRYKESNMVKPFTTNGFISAFADLASATNNAHQPMENLGAVNVLDQVNETTIDCESDELIALGLPTKLDFAYLIVYSDIVANSQFYGGANGQQKIPAMAYISRNYSQGDYFYSFTTNWTYTADRDYILTEINTNIILPNGEPAPIEPNSSVIYKITKPKSMPPPPLPLKEDKGKQDTKKDENKTRNEQESR
jgi:hypothetical protein